MCLTPNLHWQPGSLPLAPPGKLKWRQAVNLVSWVWASAYSICALIVALLKRANYNLIELFV